MQGGSAPSRREDERGVLGSRAACPSEGQGTGGGNWGDMVRQPCMGRKKLLLAHVVALCLLHGFCDDDRTWMS